MPAKSQEQIENTETIKSPNVKTVQLENPIIRTGQTITTIGLGKPNVGTLRNLSLQDVLKWDISATNVVFTRISQPSLTIDELNNMDIGDYTSLCVELTDFLVSAKAKSQAMLTT